MTVGKAVAAGVLAAGMALSAGAADRGCGDLVGSNGMSAVWILDVAGGGRYAYLAAHSVNGSGTNGGVRVMDLADPAAPVQVGELDWDDSEAIAVVGGTAYLAGDGLRVASVADPFNPAQLGSWDNGLLGTYDLAVVGTTVYAAKGTGMVAFDVSDPYNPALVGGCNTAGNVLSLAVAGNYAYLAGDNAGLLVVDLSTMTQVGSFAAAVDAHDVALAGTLAYVADRTALRVLNVASPSAITQVGSWSPAAGGVWDVVLDGNRAVALGTTELWVLDISDPAAPVQVGYSYVPNSAVDGVVADGLLRLAELDYGFKVIDLFDCGNGVFQADFESGDTGGWSAVVP